MEYSDYRDVNREYNFKTLSFGCGVQSTAILMLIKHDPKLLLNTVGHLPEKAYFADTGLEPKEVYDHLDKLKQTDSFSNIKFEKIETHLKDSLYRIPYFVKNKKGKKGQLTRGCTLHHKIRPVRRCIRKDYKKKDNYSLKPKTVALWLGISTDEISRMRESQQKYIEHIYPLIELGWSREDCKKYLQSLGWMTVPKSSCFCCPYRNWKKNKKESPEIYKQAAEFEKNLNLEKDQIPYLSKIDGKVFINPSLKLLSEQSSSEIEEQDDYMNGECDGMCGT